MSSQAYEAFSNTLTAPGGSNGILTVTSTIGFRVGAYGWLRNPATLLCERVRIQSIPGATTVGVTFLPKNAQDITSNRVPYPNYGRNDCSDFDTGSTLSMPTQLVADTQL